jgi:serine/threonine protein kinase/tetratricopeptide (TPR) repeat protein
MGPGDLVVDRFEIEQLAGQGAMGTVFRALDRHAGGVVALKTLRPDATASAERFLRESRALAEIRHAGIVRYVAHGITPGGELYLAMEWLDGEDLSARLKRGAMTIEEAVEFVARVASALGAAHERGIVHRDVKPTNIFLQHGDLSRAKVLDFGVAYVQRAAWSQTMTGQIVGTPAYMAPEQARGDRDIDARADVFSLGCLLFRCLTGRAVFEGNQIAAVLTKVLLEETPRCSDHRADVPEELDDVVSMLLAKNRDARPGNGNEVAKRLSTMASVPSTSRLRERRKSSAPPVLTESEQRLLCLVLVAPDTTQMPLPRTSEATFASAETTLELARAATRTLGAEVQSLADGSIVATLSSTEHPSSASDMAAMAARCGLALRKVVERAPIAVVTGRGLIAGRWPVGEAVDRATRMLAAVRHEPWAERGVFLDDVTDGLLDARFERKRAGAAGDLVALEGEHDRLQGTRVVLGRETTCVGRDRELSALEAMLDESAAESVAHVVLVTGAPGVGKSRLRYELLRAVAASRRAVEVMLARADPTTAGSPLGLVAQLVRRAAGIEEGEPVDVRRGKLVARVERRVPVAERARVARFLGELCGAPFDDDDRQLRAARLDAVLIGDQMRRAFEDWIEAECTARPVLMVLEDLHWADAPSVAFVDSALRLFGDRPWMVLGLARPEVESLFPNLWNERDPTHVRLTPLTKGASEKLLRDIVGDALPADRLKRMAERAGGNPLFLEEIARSAMEHASDADPLATVPQTVLAMMQSRVERLPPELRKVLRAASVFGRTFWRGGVIALAGEGTGDETSAALWELVAREVVSRRPGRRFASEEDLVFRHALVRDAAYAMLTERDRAVGHRIAAEWLVGAGETDPLVLAEHFDRGVDRARAMPHYARAAEQALEANDFPGTVALVDRAIACGAEGETRGELRLRAAEATLLLGRTADCEQNASESVSSLPRGDARWFEARYHEIAARSLQGKLDALDTITSETIDAEPARDAAVPMIRCLFRASTSLFQCGRVVAAMRVYDAATARMTPALEGDPSVRTACCYARVMHAMHSHDAAPSPELFAASLQASLEAGDQRRACNQLLNLGVSLVQLGELDVAEEKLREALSISERLGLTRFRAYTLQNLGHVLAHRGALSEAREVEERAIALGATMKDVRLLGCAHAYLSAIVREQGDAESALVEADHAAEQLRAARPLLPLALATRAQALCALHQNDEALSVATEALTMIDELGTIEEGDALVRLAHVEVLEAMGRDEDATRAREAARRHLLTRAARIDDDARRAKFLENVPEHARTLAAHTNTRTSTP